MYSISIYQGDHLVGVQPLALRKAVSIGRHHLNDIHLPDPSYTVSRFHAALFGDAGGNYFLQDLGSRNNTCVNGKKRDYGSLNEGDKIQVGEYTLLFQKRIDQSKAGKSRLALMDEDPGSESAKTVFSPIPFQWGEIETLQDDPDGLLLLYRLSRLSHLSSDLEASLPSIIEELFKAFRPDRIFIALLEQQGEDPVCLARLPQGETPIRVSRTMLRSLLDENRPLVTGDALADERFKRQGKTARSILELQVRSATCIPLRWDGEIQGMLYLDSAREGLFTERDLKLLILIGNDLSLWMERAFHYRALRDEKLCLEGRLETESAIIGIAPKTRDVLKAIERVADTGATVLITGETGTGKDLMARAIHQSSKRKGKPFIGVNCAAIPDNLLESELFGVIAHYPGFHNQEPLIGKFELASGGTLFLNEIGEFPLRLQPKLLDVLEERRIWPLGKDRPVPVDIRIIAATNRDLKQEVRQGRFREDLYERLHVLPIHLAPLRERKEDIPLLAGYFLYRLRQEYGKMVRYWYKDHQTKSVKVETVDVFTFIGRMVQHILPKGFQRVNYKGCKRQRHLRSGVRQ